MSGTEAKIEITAGVGRLPASLRAALKMLQGFTTASTGLLKQHSEKELARPDRRSLAGGTFVGALGAGLAMRGIDMMVDATKEVFKFEEALTRFGIASNKTPDQMREIGNAARGISSATGLSAIDVLGAGRAYIDLAGAASFSVGKMNTLARAAQASGANTKDLAGMMYQLTRTMNVPSGELENTIGGLLNQAKAGGIEAAEMSSEFAGILPLFARFGVKGREGVVQMGAMFQVMRDGSNSAAEAATMLQRVYAGIQTNAPKFEKAGIQVYSKERDELGRKVLLPSATVLRNIMGSEAMKDPSVLKKLFGRTEGWRGMLLGDEAARAFGGTDDAIDKTVSRLGELEAAGRVNGVVAHDLATVTESSMGRIAIAIETAKNRFGEMMTPDRVDQIVGGIESITASIGPLLSIATGAATALGWVVDAGRWLGNKVRRDNQQLNDDENERYKYLQSLMPRHKEIVAGIKDHVTARHSVLSEVDAMTPAMLKELGEYETRNSTLADLQGKEEDDKPTPESFALAVRVMRKHLPPGAAISQSFTKEDLAGMSGWDPAGRTVRDYLVKNHVSEALLAKFQEHLIEQQVDEAQGKGIQAQLEGTTKLSTNKPFDFGAGDDYTGPLTLPMHGTLPPVGPMSRAEVQQLTQTLKSLGPMMARAMDPIVAAIKSIKPELRIGENPVKTAVSNAPSNRSKPR